MPVEPSLRFALASLSRSARRRGFVLVNPAFRSLLDAAGLATADDFLSHPGEIVSGHPDRHVMRVRLGGAVAWLKREHRVPVSDRVASWRAGFGFVSVSCREAAMLDVLRAKRIAAPEWLAAGEDGRGRAFLLLRDSPGVDLRRHARDLAARPLRHRRTLARRLGRLVARMHNKGIEYPDLYAKHVLIDEATGAMTFLDWQRSRRPHRLSWRDRCRDLAALNASLADELASPADRFAFLLAYLRRSGPNVPTFATLCRRIEGRTAKLLRRSSLREQRAPTFVESQPLIWLAGEALCVTPRCQAMFDAARLDELAYALPDAAGTVCQTAAVTLPDGTPAEIVRRRTVRRLARCRDALRRHRWSAPESLAAADLLRRERLGEPARLLAFGQRDRGWGVTDSFLLRTPGERRGG